MDKVVSLKAKYEADLNKCSEHRAKLLKELEVVTQRMLQLQGAIFAMEEAGKQENEDAESTNPDAPSAA
jgi:chromosome segregation ATPase